MYCFSLEHPLFSSHPLRHPVPWRCLAFSGVECGCLGGSLSTPGGLGRAYNVPLTCFAWVWITVHPLVTLHSIPYFITHQQSHTPRILSTPHHRGRSTALLFPFVLRLSTHLHPSFVRFRVQNAVKDKINLAKGDSASDRRSQIRWELDELRSQQSDNKLNRGKVIEQLKALQEGIQKKVRPL